MIPQHSVKYIVKPYTSAIEENIQFIFQSTRIYPKPKLENNENNNKKFDCYFILNKLFYGFLKSSPG